MECRYYEETDPIIKKRIMTEYGLKLEPIIRSKAENDQYKFTMAQVMLHNPELLYTDNKKNVNDWAFKDRSDDKYTPEMVAEIIAQVNYYLGLRFTKEELDWLFEKSPWLKADFREWLENLRHDRDEIEISTDAECGLKVEFHGDPMKVSFHETPVMAIICEVYNRMMPGNHFDESLRIGKERFNEKLDKLVSGDVKIGAFSEFGFRRRYCFELEDYVVAGLTKAQKAGLLKESTFVGTSNVYLAMKYDIQPVGTMAHEFTMMMQGIRCYNPAYANKFMLEIWTKEYGADNGIALTDTLGTDIFLLDFNRKLATAFSGVRHDSGDPVEWGYKMLKHYEKLRINPKDKTFLFSDGVSLEKAAMLYSEFSEKAKVAFGIGGCLSNDTDVRAKNVVIKLIAVNNYPVAKLSDTPGKGMCRDNKYIARLQELMAERVENLA